MIIVARPIACITQRIDDVQGRSEIRDALDVKMSGWLHSAGLIPVPIPNIYGQYTKIKCTAGIESWLNTVSPSVVILSGGNDWMEYPSRDCIELGILDWASMRNIPVLGICRGMQVQGIWTGGKLERVNGHVKTMHTINGQGTWPGRINSYHEWGFKTCPPDFDVIAKSADGVIEAIRHKILPWEGWMWHPERFDNFREIDKLRLERLCNNE
jgi:N5-(cytidine 5'-diphosphoramidyl)-L-glutamine hydrolase